MYYMYFAPSISIRPQPNRLNIRIYNTTYIAFWLKFPRWLNSCVLVYPSSFVFYNDVLNLLKSGGKFSVLSLSYVNTALIFLLAWLKFHQAMLVALFHHHQYQKLNHHHRVHGHYLRHPIK